jgi:hypothetical protein
VGVERTSEVDSARRDGVFDGFCQSVRFRSLGRLVRAVVVRFGAFASTTMDTKNGERGTMSRPTHICFFLELVGRLRSCVVTGVLGLFNRDFRSTMEKR